jgi:hypothetical protein
VPRTIIIAKRTKNETKLSINRPIEMLKGKIIFGKYIFFINPSLLINDAPDCVVTELKKTHGTIPENKKTVNVLISEANKDEKTSDITDIINIGLTSVHKKPSTVLLYLSISC